MRAWVPFRLLIALSTVALMVFWGTRAGELMREAGQGSWAWLAELSAGLGSLLVLVFAVVAIPLELYVLRRRRMWFVYTNFTVLGFSGVLASSILWAKPSSTLNPALAASMSTSDKLVSAGYLFITEYYLLWLPVILVAAFLAFFSDSDDAQAIKPGSKRIAAVDAGPALAYLGVLLAVVSVAQAYDPEGGPRQLVVPSLLGLACVGAVWLVLLGSRKAPPN